MRILITTLFILFSGVTIAQENTNNNKFKQLGTELPTPNTYRTGSGAPGHEYWQQKVDYDMEIRLDDEKQRLYGEETIVYTNNSPDELRYLWLQLDQNVRSKDSDSYKIRESEIGENPSIRSLERLEPWFDGGFKIDYVKDGSGKELKTITNNTMMRVDLPSPLRKGQRYTLKVKWWYNINDRMKIGGRSGLEYFEEEDNYLYTIAQFYPRLAVYDDHQGWQNKQFLGRGEFYLEFGDYKVSITAPSDHIVASTGTLQNESSVLSSKQRKRLDEARESDEPVFIVTENEAIENEKEKATGTKTWVFQADDVRDFAFASSRKFIWDAMNQTVGDNDVLCMSYYPKEGNPLWERYSTKVVAHTVKTYSKYTIDYPYPVAISVHANRIGMEYPMICFNGGRPEPDGTYTERTKYGMIGVITHEVGHNFFPMIINSDERQWTWMDEGLNTFAQYLTQNEFDRNYPNWRGAPRNITDYMGGDKSMISPIMTNSESIYQFGNNAYGKPCTALNILRETIMGRELFDYAFKEYSRRWAFKHPTPADFFRTMEDASAVDLDWFWRGWFYTTDHCDLALKEVKWFQLDNQDPYISGSFEELREQEKPEDLSRKRNQKDIPESLLEKDEDLVDFYNTWDRYKPNALDKEDYREFWDALDEEDKEFLNSDKNYYEVTVENQGGLVMPLIFRLEYTDGSDEIRRIPAEIWKMSEPTVTKVLVTEKEVKQITLDPYLETADTDLNDNYWPPKRVPSRLEIFKQQNSENPMQRAIKSKGMERDID